MGVMNRFKDMFKGEDEYDVDGYNDGYDSYDDVADEGGVNESVQAQPQPAARDMRSNGGVLSASAVPPGWLPAIAGPPGVASGTEAVLPPRLPHPLTETASTRHSSACPTFRPLIIDPSF